MKIINMKIMALCLSVLILFMAGCSRKEDPASQPPLSGEQNNQVSQTETKPEDTATEPETDTETPGNNYLADAMEGRLSGLEITFNDSLSKVIEIIGQPDEISSWQGADLYIYDNIGIYIDPFDEIVTGLSAGIGFETYGIKIGMTVDAVKSILGEPDFEGVSFESGVPALEYVAGDYLVEIVYDQESRQTVGLTIYNYSY